MFFTMLSRLSLFTPALFVSFLAAAWLILGATPVAAQNSAGIGVSPAIIEPNEQLEPGATITRTITISNLESRERTLFLVPRVIERFDRSSTPIFADRSDESTGLEIVDWISLSTEELTLAAGGEETVTVTIAVPESAPPGSHFAGIRIAADAPRLRESGAGISYGVSGIVSVVVAGETSARASIRAFATDKFIYGTKEVTFSARVENEGNVLVQPNGFVQINNMFGTEVASLDVNNSLARVVPGNERTFQVEWQEENPGFGRYEALITLSYESDEGSRTITSTVSFWILPTNIIYPALGVLAVLLLIVFVGVKLYVRRTLQMQGRSSRRLVRQRRQQGMPVGLLLLVVMLSVTALFLLVLLLLFA